MPLIGSVTGTNGFSRGSLVGLPVWITPTGSLGTLNDNQRSNTFTVQASAGPGATSVSYSVVSGSLPSGASLNTSTGVISGFSPVASNTTSNFTIRATNNVNLLSDRSFSITINAATVTWNTTSPLPGATGGDAAVAYSTTLSATASSGTLSYSVVSGSLPSGLSLNTSTGAITGTPNQSSSSTVNFTVRATTTSASVSSDRAFSITVTIIVDLIVSSRFQGIRDYFTARTSRYRNASFYLYTLDASPSSISDGGGDMYDSGAFTQIRQDGNIVANNISYNTTNTTAGNVRYGSLGYTHPLFTLVTSGRTNRRFGMSTTGNLGADGGGAQTAQRVYNTQTVNDCLVHSWLVNQAYNAGDPSVNYLYLTLGHSAFGSQINAINVESRSGNPDNDANQYETTSFNCLVIKILLSKSGGTIVNVAECQTVISNITTDFKAHFGL
jgi:hypothetical protein